MTDKSKDLEKQLKNRDNFMVNGQLYLSCCMLCENAGDRGIENYASAVSHGACAWCGWEYKK